MNEDDEEQKLEKNVENDFDQISKHPRYKSSELLRTLIDLKYQQTMAKIRRREKKSSSLPYSSDDEEDSSDDDDDPTAFSLYDFYCNLIRELIYTGMINADSEAKSAAK